jgi:sugar lactone lactonase YvrE
MKGARPELDERQAHARRAPFLRILLPPLLAAICSTLFARRPAARPGSFSTAFALPERGLVPQGIAHDSATGSFFVGSVARRKIVRRAADGSVTDFVREGQDGILGVLALGVDPANRLLWACTAAVPRMEGWSKGDLGLTAVLAYDLHSGRLARKIYPTVSHGAHEPGGLAVASSGDVYLTDSAGSGIYHISPGKDATEEFINPGVFRTPRGLAFSVDEKSLYVADELEGLWRVELETRNRAELRGPGGTILRGIGSLVRDGGRLIATQRASGGFSVVSLELAAGGRRIRKATVIAWDGDFIAETAQGVVVRGELYLVARESAVARLPLLP